MVKEKELYTSMNEAEFYYYIGNNPKIAKIFIEQVIKKEIHELVIKNPKLLKDYLNTKERTRILVAEEKGIQKGTQREKIEIAKNMLSKNTDINFISEVTGLTKEEISKLK